MKCPKCNGKMTIKDTYAEGEYGICPEANPYNAWEKTQIWGCDCGYLAEIRASVVSEGLDYRTCRADPEEWKSTRKKGQVKLVQ